METNQVNPGVSDGQRGAESPKRAAEDSTDSEKYLQGKKQRGPFTLESSAQENEVELTAFDKEFASSNSRWEARDELSTLGTTSKRMNKFERRTLVRSYPWPDVDAVYTPSMDDCFNPLIPGIMALDKPLENFRTMSWTHLVPFAQCLRIC